MREFFNPDYSVKSDFSKNFRNVKPCEKNFPKNSAFFKQKYDMYQ